MCETEKIVQVGYLGINALTFESSDNKSFVDSSIHISRRRGVRMCSIIAYAKHVRQGPAYEYLDMLTLVSPSSLLYS